MPSYWKRRSQSDTANDNPLKDTTKQWLKAKLHATDEKLVNLDRKLDEKFNRGREYTKAFFGNLTLRGKKALHRHKKPSKAHKAADDAQHPDHTSIDVSPNTVENQRAEELPQDILHHHGSDACKAGVVQPSDSRVEQAPNHEQHRDHGGLASINPDQTEERSQPNQLKATKEIRESNEGLNLSPAAESKPQTPEIAEHLEDSEFLSSENSNNSSSTTSSTSSYWGDGNPKWEKVFWGNLRSINHATIVRLVARLLDAGEGSEFEVIDQISGAYHAVYIIQSRSGTKTCLKIPAAGQQEIWSDEHAKNLRSEALTMRLIQQKTKVPVPTLIAYDTSFGNEIGAPFILETFAAGRKLGSLLRDWSISGCYSEKIGVVYQSFAHAMAELSRLKFNQVGMLDFLTDEGEPSIAPQLVPYWCDLDNAPDIEPDLVNVKQMFHHLGPFSDSKSYFSSRLQLIEGKEWEGFREGVFKLLEACVSCVPSFVDASGTDEVFSLVHPDLDVQNILCEDDGNITGIIDWEGVHTAPIYIGHASTPFWLREDWNPGYQWPYGDELYAPDDLIKGRKLYSAALQKALNKDDQWQYPEKSVMLTALLYAISTTNTVARCGEFIGKILAIILPNVHAVQFCEKLAGIDTESGGWNVGGRFNLEIYLKLKITDLFVCEQLKFTNQLEASASTPNDSMGDEDDSSPNPDSTPDVGDINHQGHIPLPKDDDNGLPQSTTKQYSNGNRPSPTERNNIAYKETSGCSCASSSSQTSRSSKSSSHNECSQNQQDEIIDTIPSDEWWTDSALNNLDDEAGFLELSNEDHSDSIATSKQPAHQDEGMDNAWGYIGQEEIGARQASDRFDFPPEPPAEHKACESVTIIGGCGMWMSPCNVRLREDNLNIDIALDDDDGGVKIDGHGDRNLQSENWVVLTPEDEAALDDELETSEADVDRSEIETLTSDEVRSVTDSESLLDDDVFGWPLPIQEGFDDAEPWIRLNLNHDNHYIIVGCVHKSQDIDPRPSIYEAIASLEGQYLLESLTVLATYWVPVVYDTGRIVKFHAQGQLPDNPGPVPSLQSRISPPPQSASFS